MELVIGIRDLTRELSLDINDDDEAAVTEAITAAVSGTSSQLDLTDTKGNRYLIPATTIAFVQIGAKAQRRVGFGV